MQLPDSFELVLTALGGAAATWLGLRRKYNKDSTDIARDKVETEFMITLRAERDQALATAREAWAQRIDDARTIATLQAEVTAGHRETERLRDELFALRIRMGKIVAIVVKLDPAAAATLELDRGPRDGIPTSTDVFTQGPVHLEK